MRKLLFVSICVLAVGTAQCQNLIPIPDTLSGSTINLMMADSSHQFVPGFTTHTIGYNGAYLGPTIILNKGQQVTMNMMNMLSDTTTTHWHGLHVEPMNDGGPHTPILPGAIWSPSFTVLDNAALYWYHPHAHHKTMTQVLKGAAGLIIVRDSVESALNLPRTYGVDDIPLVCQFQHMDSTTKEFIMSDELDNICMVNGTLDPMVNVPAQFVRLRILNASSHRVLQFGFSDGRTFHQITSDAGLLDAPVALTRLRLGSGERAEILVDFSGQEGNTVYINQFGNELPSGYPGGPAMMGGTIGPLDNITFHFLQVNVVAATANPITIMPAVLTTNTVWSQTGAGTATFLLQGSPAMSMTNFTINGTQFAENVINFTTTQDSVMIWQITNQSMMAHPWHIHGNHFYLLSVNGAVPPANMLGRKDVVIVPPSGGVVRLITKYADFSDPLMPFMYHCHILSHEDNGMMGQFIINPAVTQVENNNATDAGISVYPNPTNDMIHVTSKKEVIRKIEVTDQLGKIIYSENKNDLSFILNLSAYSKGIYFISLQIEKLTSVFKIIIK